MLTATQLERYAQVLIWGLKTARGTRFKKGDIVLIRYHQPAIFLAEVLHRRLLEKGLQPVQRMLPTLAMERDFYMLAKGRQLVFQTPGDKTLFRALNGSIFLNAPQSLTHLKDVAPQKFVKTAVAAKPSRDILRRREAQGDFSWTLGIYPTEALAAQAGISPEAYTRQIVRACFLNRRSPLELWKSLLRQARSLKKWLNSLQIRRLHVESAGIDLEIAVGEQRRWLGVSGRNIPSFEIFVSPDWRGTRGVYFADQPSFRSGNFVEGVRLEFRAGKVVDIESRKGEAFARRQLETDAGARRVGEFSLTDKTFSKIDTFMANTLYDENYGGKNGNCHIALGAAYASSFDGAADALTAAAKTELGFNDSALHWDLVNTEKKRVTAHLPGGRRVTLYENGRFIR